MVKNSKPLILLFLFFIIGLLIVQGAAAKKEQKPKDEDGIPYAELRMFTDIYGRIKSSYVDDVDDDKLLRDAIRGMLAGLDPHSSFLDNDEYSELRIGTSGKFGGLGIEVGMEDGFVKVISPMDDTPAQRAGVQAGDLIIRLDDTPVKGMTLNDAIKKMRGEAGTDIILTIVRDKLDGPIKISITRDIIEVKSVKNKVFEDVYGYIRITQFQMNTSQYLVDAVEELNDKSKQPLQGYLLDLRNNPGGVLDAAIEVSDAFLDGGMVVSHEGRAPNSNKKYNAAPGDIIDGLPLVVLVNRGSASASEIVAGALQDHSRAIVLGTKTFGKGSVQTIQELNNGSALKLTTARYFTPKGHSIQAEGIKPDIEIDPIKIRYVNNDNGFEPISEANLDRHLTNPNDEDNKSAINHNQPKEKTSLAETDYQLFEAINLLKGLNIVKNTTTTE